MGNEQGMIIISLYFAIGLIMTVLVILFDKTAWYFWIFMFFLYPVFIIGFTWYAIKVATKEPDESAKKLERLLNRIEGRKQA